MALAPLNQCEATSSRSGPMIAALPAKPGIWQLWQVTPLRLYALSCHSSYVRSTATLLKGCVTLWQVPQKSERVCRSEYTVS
ncbi:hypothetical protein D3C81_2127370 [compost metagenome]